MRVARVGDPGSHGGALATGSPSLTSEGIPVSRVGDIYECPVHGASPMAKGSSGLSADGRAVCRVGDRAECGGIIVSGSESFDDASS